jgi:hypothetical protein
MGWRTWWRGCELVRCTISAGCAAEAEAATNEHRGWLIYRKHAPVLLFARDCQSYASVDVQTGTFILQHTSSILEKLASISRFWNDFGVVFKPNIRATD